MQVYNEIAEEWNEYKQKPLPAAQMLLKYVGGKTALDAGTGNGRHLPLLLEKFDKVCAVDTSEKLLQMAAKKYPQVNFSLADVCALPFAENIFDTILCTAVLHHLKIDEVTVAFNEFHRVLKTSGTLLGTVWNKHQPRFEKITENEAMIGWKMKSGETAQRFVHFFEKEELEKFATDAGFDVEKIFYELNGREHEKNGAGNLCFVMRKI